MQAPATLTQAPSTLTASDAHDVPTYANLWDLCNGRTVQDDAPEWCESVDFALTLDLS